MYPSTLRHKPPGAWQQVMEILQQIAPLEFAASWDNVGLLIDCTNPERWSAGNKPRIFLCNDLTEPVAEEAIKWNTDLVITYHPTPFGKSNKFVRSSHISRVVLSMISNRIAVYSTHTAFDCVQGGLNDWLINCFPGVREIRPCEPSKLDPACGFGRVARISARSIEDCIEDVKRLTGLEHVRLAEAVDPARQITHVAVCAGCEGSVFKAMDLKKERVDLVVSGEMSHHDVLELVQNNIFVILTEHSNSERGFLPEAKKMIEAKLQERGLGSDWAEIAISTLDKDPLSVR